MHWSFWRRSEQFGSAGAAALSGKQMCFLLRRSVNVYGVKFTAHTGLCRVNSACVDSAAGAIVLVVAQIQAAMWYRFDRG